MSQNVMSGDVTQENRLIAIDSPLGQDVLLLTSVQGEDVVSTCFTYTIEFITKAADADVRRLVGQSVTIWLDNDQTQRVPINGFIRRVMDKRITLKGFKGYRAEVVPRLWFLECTSDCRIFQNMTVPKIVETILQDYGVTSYQFRVTERDYPEVEYCVQYRESALAFISRLLEHVGIYFYHEHKEGSHKLILTDANKRTDKLTGQALTIAGPSRAGEIESIATETSFQPDAWALSDYDFTGPTKQMHKQAKTTLPTALPTLIERFDFPGGYADHGIGEWQANLRMQAEEAAFNRTYGEGWAASFFPGYRFELDEEEDGGEPREYLLLEVRHHAKERSYFGGEEGGSEYHNSFVAVATNIPFRPRRRTPKSIIHGAQTATVVSATPGDPIYTDKYGRVKLHFHWDRHGKPSSGATSCWVRVAQNSAGAGFGGVFTPHAGQEVVVEFLEGDPDRPLITGRVHNADKTPPLNLPADKHKSITRDHGNNNFIMHGQPGGEHMSLFAPRWLNFFAISSISNPFTSGANSVQMFTLPNLIANPNPSAYQTLGNVISSVTMPADTLLSELQNTPTQTDVSASSYSVTEGDSSEYIGGDYNSWYQGAYYCWYGDNSNSVTLGDANTVVLGALTSETVGAALTMVGGANTSVTVGINTSVTLGPTISVALGGTLNINKGYQKTLVPFGETESGDWNVTATGLGQVTMGTTLSFAAPGGADYTVGGEGFSVLAILGGGISITSTTGSVLVATSTDATFAGEASTTLGDPSGATSILGSEVSINGELIQIG
jgi:type VI secretion system secreted protein VgrG